jgi:hypothetical protein
MPHPSWDNPAEFVDQDDFAVRGVILFQDGTRREITGIYDGPYREGKLGEYEQDTTKPKFTCVEGVCKGARRGDGLEVYEADGVTLFGTFNIMTYPQPDGTGLEVLELTEE